MRKNLRDDWGNIRKQGAVRVIFKITMFWVFGWGLPFTLFIRIIDPEAISKKFFLHLSYISVLGGLLFGTYIWIRFEQGFRKKTISLLKPDDIHWHTGGVQFVYHIERDIRLGIECFGVPIDGKIPYMISRDKDLWGLLIDNQSNPSMLQTRIEEHHILDAYNISWINTGGTRVFSFKAKDFIPLYETITRYIHSILSEPPSSPTL